MVCFGSNTNNRATPPALTGTPLVNYWLDVSCGDAYCCGVWNKIDWQEVKCWGYNPLGTDCTTVTGKMLSNGLPPGHSSADYWRPNTLSD